MQHPVLWQTCQKYDCVCTCSGVNLYCVVIAPDGIVPDGNLALMKTQTCVAHAFFTLLSCINIFNTLSLGFPK